MKNKAQENVAAKKHLIRQAIPADAQGIATVHVKSWQETYAGIISPEVLNALSIPKRQTMWNQILTETSDDHTFVAVIDDQVVGFVNGGKAREQHGYDGELNAIYLLQAYQNLGIGKQLFVALIESLKQDGLNSMYLWVLADNRIVSFYEAMGGKKGLAKEDKIGGQTLLEVLFSWETI